jgi:predicted transcriptional regulator
MGLYLVEPTDFEILSYLAEEGRNNAVNVAAALEQNREYMNTRFRRLASHECVERIGPAENSGLYEITEKGKAALEHRDLLDDPDADFGARVKAAVGDDPVSAED